ncbi:DUF3311 domain-containing protein [Streptomyces sp. NBC_00536]|uniref:DUF3311 domain-containing protein n=1 Tax=Streptomyces sp. NBC_00536 TaxID=2975769 RepID=UPI002E808E81|nr:DUF3311 domain-containing protein [Streptomyces sp. NBC_00536]WUC79253.1 DUF3311 domain-containing protein [Streptomyces sp. NBC_00536]
MRSKRVKRPQLVWLAAPFVLFLGVLPLVNRVEPLVFGRVPFLLVWCVGATLLTPLAVWLAWRGDHR